VSLNPALKGEACRALAGQSPSSAWKASCYRGLGTVFGRKRMKTTLPASVNQDPVDYWKVLCSKAFEVVQGMDYNKVASEIRDKTGGFTPFLYDVVCKKDLPWENFKDRVYPSFVRYLNYKSLDPGSGQGFIVSLYYEERFYLIGGPDFIGAFCEIEGVDHSTYHAYVLQWLSEGSH
jgi:hypothetical protein